MKRLTKRQVSILAELESLKARLAGSQSLLQALRIIQDRMDDIADGLSPEPAKKPAKVAQSTGTRHRRHTRAE